MQLPAQENRIIGFAAVKISRCEVFNLKEAVDLLGEGVGEHECADVSPVFRVIGEQGGSGACRDFGFLVGPQVLVGEGQIRGRRQGQFEAQFDQMEIRPVAGDRTAVSRRFVDKRISENFVPGRRPGEQRIPTFVVFRAGSSPER